MPKVNTVSGQIDVNQLGFTLMHEHLRESSAGVTYTFPDLFDHDEDVARCIAALNQASLEGMNTIVDVTTMDLGRDMRLLQDISNEVNINIIPATGLWLDIPRSIGRGTTPDQLAKAFIREIEDGIERTNIRAGVIKVATDVQNITENRINSDNELVLRAAARASKETGVPISTHTSSLHRTGDYQVAIFEEEGVDLQKVCIGHSNDTDNLEYLIAILNKGCLLGMDHFPGGSRGGLNWEERTRLVKDLVDLGFANQLTLSHDFGGSRPSLPEDAARRNINNPDGYCFIARNVIPRLLELGVTQDTIFDMTVGAPRRFFGGE